MSFHVIYLVKSVFLEEVGRGYKLVTLWKTLVYIYIWQYFEFLKFFMYLKIRRL